jgi:hypothetical protein
VVNEGPLSPTKISHRQNWSVSHSSGSVSYNLS